MIVFRQTRDETKKTYCPISLGAILINGPSRMLMYQAPVFYNKNIGAIFYILTIITPKRRRL